MHRLERLGQHVVPRSAQQSTHHARHSACGVLGRKLSVDAAGDPLLAALALGDQRYISDAHVHVVSHCTVPKEKAAEFWALSRELVPHCRFEPYVLDSTTCVTSIERSHERLSHVMRMPCLR